MTASGSKASTYQDYVDGLAPGKIPITEKQWTVRAKAAVKARKAKADKLAETRKAKAEAAEKEAAEKEAPPKAPKEKKAPIPPADNVDSSGDVPEMPKPTAAPPKPVEKPAPPAPEPSKTLDPEEDVAGRMTEINGLLEEYYQERFEEDAPRKSRKKKPVVVEEPESESDDEPPVVVVKKKTKKKAKAKVRVVVEDDESEDEPETPRKPRAKPHAGEINRLASRLAGAPPTFTRAEF